MKPIDKIIIRWASIIWVCLFMCYYAICIIYYYSNHTQEEHDYLCDSSNPGFYTEFPRRQFKILTFQKIEIVCN